MIYIIITNCKDPYTAKTFTMLSSDDNMVYEDYDAAKIVVKVLDKEYGEGYAKMIAL